MKELHNVLGKAETKLELFGSEISVFVTRNPGEKLNYEFVIPKFKPCGFSIIMYGCTVEEMVIDFI